MPTTEPTYDEVTEWLLEHHQTLVTGHTFWSWTCRCGKAGLPTTQGRAIAGRDRHLKAQRRARMAQVGHAT